MVGSLASTVSRRRLRVLALGVFVAASLLGTIGTAQAAPTHLFPESFIAGDPPFPGTNFAYTSNNCLSGNGTFAFEAAGDAGTPPAFLPGGPFAPYPGTFEETGTVTLTNGVLTGFHSDFTIVSGAEVITGTQDLAPSTQNAGVCESGRLAMLAVAAYTANTPGGQDTGCAHVTVENTAGGFMHGGQPSSSGALFTQFDNACDPPPPPITGTVTGTVTDQNGAPIPQGPTGAAACPGPTGSPSCAGLQVALTDPSGHYTLVLAPGLWTVGGFATVDGQLYLSTTTTITLTAGQTITENFTVIVPTRMPGGGTFVIGSQNAAVGSTVTFWGSQWAKSNGGQASSFKGFATTSANGPTCGQGWAARPGDSSNPPATVPQYMAVAVTSAATKSGSTISGDTIKVVLVKTNARYDNDPGHPGSATVVAVLCGG